MSKYPAKGLTGITPGYLDWLSGSWKGPQGRNQYEEHWSSSGGGTLMGMFRWLKDGQVWFYEFITIEPAGEFIMMRIKHFYPGMKGWEEKDQSTDFLLVELQDKEAVFLQVNRPDQWLVYRMEAQDRLVSYFHTDTQPAGGPEDTFSFVREQS